MRQIIDDFDIHECPEDTIASEEFQLMQELYLEELNDVDKNIRDKVVRQGYIYARAF
jgi:hypothetical protein